MDIEERFEQYGGDYLQFAKVENKRSSRPDIHAFILLNELFPSDADIISAAEHDEIYLDVDGEEIESLTDAQILELTRCGVRYSEESLAMFV